MRAAIPRSARERVHAVLGLVLIAVIVAFAWGARAGHAAAPRFSFGTGVLDLGPLFRADARASGAVLTLREVYENGYRIWSKQALPAAERLRRNGELRLRLAQEAGRARRVDLLDLERIVAMESAGKIEVGTNRSGFTGLFQLGPAACSDVGVSFDEVSRDWRKNLEAGVRFVDLLHQRVTDALRKEPALAAVEVDPFLLYLAHQQGTNGALAILRTVKGGASGDEPAGRNLTSNLMQGSTFWKQLTALDHRPTVLEFYVFFRGAFDAVAAELQ